MPNNRRRGATYEREVAHALNDLLGLDARRACQSGVKSGRDVEGWPGVRIECKRKKAIALVRALEQAEGDASDGELPLVVAREDRGQSVVMLRLADLVRLCELVASAKGRPIYPFNFGPE